MLFFSRQLNNQHQNTIFFKKKTAAWKKRLYLLSFERSLHKIYLYSWSLENAAAQVVLVKSGSFSLFVQRRKVQQLLCLSFLPLPFFSLSPDIQFFPSMVQFSDLSDPRGGKLQLIFAGYVSLASQSPYHIIVYYVANYRPLLGHFWANV